MAEAFSFELVSPESLILSGQASEVVVPGTEGYFTVMARHAPVMALVKPGIIEAKMADGKTERYVIYGGFADVTPEGLTVLAEHAVHVYDFDKQDLQARLEKAQEAVENAKQDHTKSAAMEFLDQLTTLDGAISHGVLS